MASVANRQRPDDNLKGKDPNYHPNKDGYWDKDAMLNNCSAMQVTAVNSIMQWDKFFEYFWNDKGEPQQLQTPGMMIVTLTERQTAEQKQLLRQGFTILHHFPSCHGGYLNTVFVKNNPLTSGEDNKEWQKYLQAGKKNQARLMKEVEAERKAPPPEPDDDQSLEILKDQMRERINFANERARQLRAERRIQAQIRAQEEQNQQEIGF